MFSKAVRHGSTAHEELTDCLLSYGHGLEVTTEQGWHSSELAVKDRGIDRGGSIEPGQPSIHMQLVVSDGRGDGIIDGCNLRKVANSQALATRTPHNVVRRMFVGVRSLVSGTVDSLESSVDTQSHVRVNVGTHAVDNRLW